MPELPELEVVREVLQRRVVGQTISAIEILPPDSPIAVYCQHGARSTAAISVLSRWGYRNLLQVNGGFAAWEQAGFEVKRGTRQMLY